MEFVILLGFAFGEIFISLLLCDVFLNNHHRKIMIKLVLSLGYCIMMSYADFMYGNGAITFCILLFYLFLYCYLSVGSKIKQILMVMFLTSVNLMVINAVFLALAFVSAQSAAELLSGNEKDVLYFYTLLSKAALFFEYLCLKQRNLNRSYFDQVVWKWVVSISLISIIINHVCFYEYIQNNASLYATVLVFVGIIITNVLVYVLCMELSNRAREAVQSQIAIEAIRYEQQTQIEMENLVDKMNKISHDFDKHILVIKDMIEKNDTSMAKEYVEKIELASRQVVFNTSSSVLNYVLGNKITYAKQLGIDVHYMVFGQEVDYIDDVDMTGLVGNLLDNAIEAAVKSKEKRLEIRFEFQDKHVATFLVKNSYNHSIEIEGKQLITTKVDKAKHGIGMKVIQEIVDKYNGQDCYQFDDGQFSHLCVLLNNKEIGKLS